MAATLTANPRRGERYRNHPAREHFEPVWFGNIRVGLVRRRGPAEWQAVSPYTAPQCFGALDEAERWLAQVWDQHQPETSEHAWLGGD